LKIEARPLSGTAFARAWLEGDALAGELLPGHPSRLESYRERISHIEEHFDRSSREDVAAELIAGGSGSEARLERFIRDEGFVVTTGQQPGLFGGPLFTLYKALTAAALAERLEAELKRPVLPVFWIASEHHRWDDLRMAHAVDMGNELREVALPSRSGPDLPVHRFTLGADTTEAVEAFLSLLPNTEFAGRWASLLREAYAPGRNPSQAFASVMTELLADSGVFLIEAHASCLKQRALPILLRELRESASRETGLAGVIETLAEGGFEPQVPLLEGATNLFFESPSGRERIFRDGERLRLRGSEQGITCEEVEAAVREDPSLLSPNVLLRPVVEAALLPTLAYVGGPGEIAYLGQTAPVFAGHEVVRPVVHPRGAFVVLEARIEKVLRKFELEVEELSLPYHEVAGRLARDEMPEDVRRALEDLRGGVSRSSAALTRSVQAVDPTLKGAVGSFEGQVESLLADIERKIVQGLKRENEIALGQVEKAQTHLFPLGRPQERVLNPFSYLVRYDKAFLNEVRDAARRSLLL